MLLQPRYSYHKYIRQYVIKGVQGAFYLSSVSQSVTTTKIPTIAITPLTTAITTIGLIPYQSRSPCLALSSLLYQHHATSRPYQHPAQLLQVTPSSDNNIACPGSLYVKTVRILQTNMSWFLTLVYRNSLRNGGENRNYIME